MKLLYCVHFLLLFIPTAGLAAPVTTLDEAIKLATRAIHKYHLTTLKDECGLVDASEKPGYFEVRVRERHSPSCGGAPETGSHLFAVRVRKRDGKLTSDVYDGVSYKAADHVPGRDP